MGCVRQKESDADEKSQPVLSIRQCHFDDVHVVAVLSGAGGVAGGVDGHA